MNITFRAVPNILPPERVFADGALVGHVEYRGDGWVAYDRTGSEVGFATAKADAGRILAEAVTAVTEVTDSWPTLPDGLWV